MDQSYDVRMEKAREYFRSAASRETDAARREQYHHLGEMTEAIQEVMRMTDVLQDRLAEVRHTLGVR